MTDCGEGVCEGVGFGTGEGDRGIEGVGRKVNDFREFEMIHLMSVGIRSDVPFHHLALG